MLALARLAMLHLAQVILVLIPETHYSIRHATKDHFHDISTMARDSRVMILIRGNVYIFVCESID